MRYRNHGEDLDSWLALGATLTLFAELHYVLTPPLSSDFVSHGDFLRVLAYGVLLVGVWRAIRSAEFGRAVAEERARVAREIHDGLAQYLFAISTHASMLETGAPLETTLPKLTEAAAPPSRRRASPSWRSRPRAATRPSTPRCAATSSSSPPTASSRSTSRSTSRCALAPDEQIEVFRIVQEGPRERAQARGARSGPRCWIGERAGRRVVRVRDDGIGFDGEGVGRGAGAEEHAPADGHDRGRLLPALAAGPGTTVEVDPAS